MDIINVIQNTRSQILYCIQHFWKASFLMAGGLIFSPCPALAGTDEGGAIKSDGYAYEYRKVPNFLEGSFTQDYGLITVQRSGQEIYQQITDELPGCPGISALQSIKVNRIQWRFPDEKNKQELLLFCGSPLRGKPVLRVYDPEFGFVAALGFGNRRFRFEQNENGDYIVFLYMDEMEAVGAKNMDRLVMYKLEKVQNQPARFTEKMDAAMKKQAERYIDSELAYYLENGGYQHAVWAMNMASQSNNEAMRQKILDLVAKKDQQRYEKLQEYGR